MEISLHFSEYGNWTTEDTDYFKGELEKLPFFRDKSISKIHVCVMPEETCTKLGIPLRSLELLKKLAPPVENWYYNGACLKESFALLHDYIGRNVKIAIVLLRGELTDLPQEEQRFISLHNALGEDSDTTFIYIKKEIDHAT